MYWMVRGGYVPADVELQIARDSIDERHGQPEASEFRSGSESRRRKMCDCVCRAGGNGLVQS